MLAGQEAPPCLILAHADSSFAATTGQSLRRLGWDVYLARSGAETRRLAGLLDPSLIVLATELPDESGWLTCEKLTAMLPGTRVVLIADSLDSCSEPFASFVGAITVIQRAAGPTALLDAVSQPPSLPAAG